MKVEHVLFSCDYPRCRACLDVPRREGHWRGQPQQEAENAGWYLGHGQVLCPEHDPTFAVVDGERR